MPDRSVTGRRTSDRRSSGPRVPRAYNAESGRANVLRSWLAPLLVLFHLLRTEAKIVQSHTDESADHRQVAKPLERPFPEPDGPRHARIGGQAAVGFRMVDVVQYVDDVRAA